MKSAIPKLVNRLALFPISIHILLVGLAFLSFTLSKSWLDASYASSGHPVDYATGQLAFDGSKVSEYYRSMETLGTLEIYWQTQWIDFLFIASIAIMGITLGALIIRLSGSQNLLRILGWATVVLACLGASFDVAENLLSFLQLWLHPDIPQILAFAYSASAAAKFACLTLAMVAFAMGMIGTTARSIFSLARR